MFDTLVVSTSQRRQGRTAKFFVCTSIVYLSVAAFAFALSVLLATPKLADTASAPPAPIFLRTGGPEKPNEGGQPPVVPTKDPRNVKSLEQIITNLDNSRPPVIQDARPPGTEIVGELDLSPGDGGVGLPGMHASTGRDPGSNVASDPPKPPEPPKAQPRPAEKSKPLPVSSTVLQGKAIERVVPIYPELPKTIRMPGEVSVEVIISPEGMVESTRAVSGHLMFVKASLEAARRWRFHPTLLNGVPVRVTGVITFVFKLNE
jgi:periplasmic protein TonB